MNMLNPISFFKLTASAAAIVSIAACQSTLPENPALADARAAYATASANPNVMRTAQIELRQAREALDRAEDEWAREQDIEQTRSLAYIARQRVEIASAIAARAAAEERVRAADAERERVRADVRTREAQQAQQRAAQSQSQASQAQQQTAQAQSQADSATERARRLEAELRELQAKQTPRGMVVTLGDVLFDTGSANLRSGALRSIERLAAVLRNYPERRVLIEGFTDSTGSDSMNLQLSQRRADAVRAALAAQGAPLERIDVSAYGEANPVASNDTAAGRQLNRRVEIVFSDNTGRFASR